MKKTVEDYIAAAPAWQAELVRLREILQSTGLEETIKWGAPCYTLDGKNVVGIGAFKSYVGLWFYQGALLADKAGVLINAQTGRTKAMRQWRFESPEDIKPAALKRYVKEAAALAQAGREIKAERNKPVQVPVELKTALDKRKRAGTAFARLTPGRQREFADYVAGAKRDATKASRIEKILPMIEAGIGLNDKYRPR